MEFILFISKPSPKFFTPSAIGKLVVRSFVVSSSLILLACSHGAKTTSVSVQQSSPVQINKTDFYFRQFNFSPREERDKEYLTKSGYQGQEYAAKLKNEIEITFAANGILANVVVSEGLIAFNPTEEYWLVATPEKLTITQQSAGGRFYDIKVDVAMFKKGSETPIWTGTKNFPITSLKGISGNWTLGLLNELKNSGIISLPRGHAVTPKGNRNYVSD